MRLAIFDTHHYEHEFFNSLNESQHHDLVFLETRLLPTTAALAKGFGGVCAFVHDQLNRETLEILAGEGVRLIALRSAGFNHVDLVAAKDLSLKVLRVPAYSPHAVAEHTLALALTLNRKIHRAYTRVREGNFSLEGLMGFDFFQKKIGIVGVGKIGREVARLFHGLGCEILAYDVQQDTSLISRFNLQYVELPELYQKSDVISLHLPLNPGTRHLIDEKAIFQMKKGVMLLNTGRGALLDTSALIQGLKKGHIGSAGLDVYEEEEIIFSQDLSDQVLQDDILARLLTFPNVVITAHQAYFTQEALRDIVRTTLENVTAFENKEVLVNEVKP